MPRKLRGSVVNMAKHADTPERKKLWAEADKVVNDQTKLTPKQHKQIAAEATKVKDGDLYRHLHRVGDDTAKSEIEWALGQILDVDTFRKVVAVFKIAVTD